MFMLLIVIINQFLGNGVFDLVSVKMRISHVNLKTFG